MSRRTWKACRQNGHSKSPYSTSVTGARAGPRRWSRSVTGTRSLGMGSLLPRSEGLERLEDAVGARVDADRRGVAPRDRAIVIEDEQRARRGALIVVVGAVAPCNLSLRLEVGQQREPQPAILRVG